MIVQSKAVVLVVISSLSTVLLAASAFTYQPGTVYYLGSFESLIKNPRQNNTILKYCT
jgi:hypothetical protein